MLSAVAAQRILEVTRNLARPFDLVAMLAEVVEAGKAVLHADAGSAWLYDPATDELVMQVATAMMPIRLPVSVGIVGECARGRCIINVPDCYADKRFNAAVDRSTGYRTRCMLTLPLLGYDSELVGVLQLLNREDGVFSSDDETVAVALAAQCAVAIQRAQATEAIIAAERLAREIGVAREIQLGTLPRVIPSVSGYDIAGTFRPADETGGDVFDLVAIAPDRAFLLLGDATGHGIGPALSSTQVRAMSRLALRLGVDIDDMFAHINDQLVEDLPDDRFVTAFFGVLDASTHQIRYHAGGQGPLLHFHARSGGIEWLPATSMPMGFLPHRTRVAARLLDMAPGDVVAVVSDGVFECEDPAGVQFGRDRVAELVVRHSGTAAALTEVLLDAVTAFADGRPQDDDVTMVIVRRLPD